MFSISVRLVALIRAICTKPCGRWFAPPFADPQENHNSLPASVAPTCLPSARFSQSFPSGVTELYGPADHDATVISLKVGVANVSFHENTLIELVLLCETK